MFAPSNTPANLCAELAPWLPKRRLAAILRAAGLRVVVGDYSVRVEGASHFAFQEFL